MICKNKKKVLKARKKMAEAIIEGLDQAKDMRDKLVKNARVARTGTATSNAEMQDSEQARKRLAKEDQRTGTDAAPAILAYHRGKLKRQNTSQTDAAARSAARSAMIGGQKGEDGDPRYPKSPKIKKPELMRRMLRKRPKP